MKKFLASIPRRMYWSNEVGGHSRCPECNGALDRERHTYVMGVRQCGETHALVVGNDNGYFCGRCPVVVLDHKAFGDFAALGIRSVDNFKFVVVGMVDVDAVPKEKRHLPFDDKSNPLPLVKFTNFQGHRRGR